jgi:hypothetical protein
MKVYISYSEADAELAQRLIDACKEMGFEVLCLSPAKSKSSDGGRLSEELISRSDVTVCLLSRSSIASAERATDMRLADELKKTVVPVLIGDVSASELPANLAIYQVLRVGTADTLNGLIDQLREFRNSLLATSASPSTEPPSPQPTLSRRDQLLELARVYRASPEVAVAAPPGTLADAFYRMATRRSGARSAGYLLGRVAVASGLAVLGYLYWDKIAASVGALLTFHKGVIAAFPAAKKAKSAGRSGQVDRIECCVFAPAHVRPRQRIQVQVPFFHRDEIEDVLKEVKSKDPTAIQKRDAHAHTLALSVRRGSRLTINVDGDGLGVRQAEQTVKWAGTYCFCEFWLDAPEGNIGWTYTPEIRVFLGAQYLGSIVFRMPCVSGELSARSQLMGDDARGPEPIFFSYARKDFRVVKTIADSWLALGLEFFHDNYNLLPGDNFIEVIDTKIDRSRTFYLFWTHHAKESRWVKREYDRAVKRRKESDLRLPVIITYGVAMRKFPWLTKTIPDGEGFLATGTQVKLPLDVQKVVGSAWTDSFLRDLRPNPADWGRES